MSNITKYGFLFIIICLTCTNLHSQATYWEDLSSEERVGIIMDSATYPEALNFYFGQIETGENSQIKTLLQKISETRVFNPLYFYLFNMVLTNVADNDIKVLLLRYSYYIFIMFPNEVLGSPFNVHFYYAFNAGVWLSFNHDETDRQAKLEAVRNQVKAFENLKKDNVEIAKKFLDEFERAARINKLVE